MGGGRRIGVLLNPSSGKGAVGRQARAVLAALGSRGDEVVELRGDDAEHANAVVAEAVGVGLDALVAVGGDGTVHLALQHVAGTQLPLGIVPLGTGNDAALALGITSHTIEGSVPAILDGHVRTFDVGQVIPAEGPARFFLCAVSTGFDALVNERANRMTWPAGSLRYVRAMLAELRTFRPLPYRALLGRGEGADAGEPSDERVDQAMFVVIANGPCYGGGMQIAAGTDMHDGRLTVIWVHELSRPRLLHLMPSVYSGGHLAYPEVERLELSEVRLDSPGLVAFADGERIGPLPITVRAVPNGVRALVPR